MRLLLAMAPLPAACTTADTDPAEERRAADVQWRPCSLEDGADDGLAECASTHIPM